MIVNRVYSWLQNNLNLEIHCLLCRGSTYWETPVCPLCIGSCPVCDFPCHRCGLPVQDMTTSLCTQCMIHPPIYDHCLSGYLYEYPVSQMIQAIKYQSRLELIAPVSRQLTHSLQDFYLDSPWPQALIPIPLHKKRLRQRGYDQTLLLARELKKQLPEDAPTLLDTRLLTRVKATDPQQGLSAIDRRKNIRQAFSLASPSSYQHIALFDDVVTTGETVSEAARLFKKSGAIRVDVWALARTPEPD